MATGQQIDHDFDYAADLRRILNNPAHRIFVSIDSDGIQGFVSGRIGKGPNKDLISRVGNSIRRILGRVPRTNERSSDVGVVDQVVIRPGRRSNYMSLGLFRALMAWFEEEGVAAVEASVWSANTTILKLSEYMGFKPVRVLLRKELN